jgi:hypothetical protein
MMRTTCRLPLRAFLLACAPLLMVLTSGTALAQDPPDPPRGPEGRDRADVERRAGPGRGWPGGPPAWQQRSGGATRDRAAFGPAQRLDQLEAKLDTLIAEVRQLRRAINRQRADAERPDSPSRGPGARRGPDAAGPPSRGAGDRGGPQPSWPPFGPRADGPMWRPFPPPAGPPWNRPGWNAPPGRRGPNADTWGPQ